MITKSPFQIISEYQKAPPVDVDALARALGIKVNYIELDEGIYGSLNRHPTWGGPSGYVIFINKKDPRVRQRFTLAHEIAHFVLHRDLIDSEVVDRAMYRSDLSTAHETQANRLAADILMPGHLLRREFAETKDVAVLARRFDVSMAAMEIRLKSLRLIDQAAPAREAALF
jgi:predicted transcriptional regulator